MKKRWADVNEDSDAEEMPKQWKPGGPILFYCGNEANVELYVNATGLMWERAPELGALLVFAEHRYYGDSQPLGAASGCESP